MSISQRGFTLIEMAMVFVVVGLMVGGGLIAIGPTIYKTRINTTNTTLDQIESALVLFAIRNNRLPCPADASQGIGTANDGLENAGAIQTSAGTQTDACSVTTKNSAVPWRTLGIDESYSFDAWGRRISYFPANNYIGSVNSLVDNSTISSGSCPAGSNCTSCLSRNTTTSTATATRATFCDHPNWPSGSTTTNIAPSYPYGNYLAVYAAAASPSVELTSAQPSAAITSTNVAAAGGRAAYVLISHGPSGFYGWTQSGTEIAPPRTYAVKAFNEAGTAAVSPNAGFVEGSAIGPLSNANYFDDIVRWRTPAYIIQLCGSGACGNP